jgi:hypothetical protein
MDSNLTISTLTFTQQFSDKKDGSLRREVSRGMNLPELMYVKHQVVKDPSTSRQKSQDVLIFEYVGALADGTIATMSRATLKVESLIDTAVTGAIVLANIERIVNTIQEDDTGLDLADEIFVNKQQ